MTPSLTLANGDRMPVIGLGLWKVPREICADLVLQAIRAGYWHLDCACDYGNEVEVGSGIRAAVSAGTCRREDLWVTSKLWNTYHRAEHVRHAVERSLRDLQLDYLDLYLVHFPIAQEYVPFDARYPPEWFYDPQAPAPRVQFAKVPLSETWMAIEELVSAGLVRNIGVCNYNCALLRDLLFRRSGRFPTWSWAWPTLSTRYSKSLWSAQPRSATARRRRKWCFAGPYSAAQPLFPRRCVRIV
jgi:diketogulonate reductase-like aldo/keto reductase